MMDKGDTGSFAVIWIDREEAKVFQFSEERMRRDTFRASRVDHHTHRLEGDEKDSPEMYEEVVRHLGPGSRILILGPGVAKTHFLDRLEKRHPLVAKRVVGCEASDHPTDPQIAAYAKKYFQKPVA